MGNYKKKKSRKDSDEATSNGMGPDMKASFMRDIEDAARRADTRSIYNFKQGRSDNSLWLPGTLLTFKDFCESADHMNFPPLSDRQQRVAEYMFGDDPRLVFENNRNTAVLVWGKGAGKDTISALLQGYVIYLLLNLSNPQRFLGLPDNTSIDLVNIAASKEQATTVFFQIFKSMVLNWRWLRGKWDLSMNGRFFSSGRQDEIDFLNKVTITNDAIIFPGNIRAFSGSCEAETLEGKNVLVFVLDEVDAFKTNSIHRSAAKIYRTMRTSAVSRFGKRHKGFIISYPRSKGGFIMDMYEKTKKLLNVYGDIAKTWEVKPRELFSKETFEFEGEKIPVDFYEDFRLDPLGSKSSYLCRPPDAESVFFDDYDKIELAAAGFSKPLFEFSDMVKEKKVVKRITKSPFMYNRSITHVMTLDLSETTDPTALTLMHREGDKVITDFITTWNPDPKTGVKVDLANVEEIIKSIRESVSVKWFVADRWNCLSGDTMIPLLDGSHPTIRELAEKKPDGGFWVYSVRDGRIVAAKASGAKKTGVSAPVLKITLDSGESVLATPEHLFMIRDGTYREARMLAPGDSLMPLYSRSSTRGRDGMAGYEKVYHPNGRWEFTHHISARITGARPGKGTTIHHRNFKKLDNSPENLIAMPTKEHLRYHQSHNENIKEKRVAGIRRWYADPKNRKRKSRIMRRVMKEKWSDPKMAARFLDGLAKGARISAASPTVSRSRREAFLRNVVAKGLKHSGHKNPSPEFRKKVSEQFKALWASPEYRAKMALRGKRNHSVVSIEEAGFMDVYDIEVPGTSNFAVGQGVFVHNSALFIQKLKSAGVNAEASKLEFDDFALFKRLLYAGNIVIPRNEQLFKELRNIQLVSKERVDHPEGGHNDMTVTLVMGVKVLVKEKGNPGGVNLAAEGEYIGENLYEAVDSFTEFVPIQSDGGLQIDGIPL